MNIRNLVMKVYQDVFYKIKTEEDINTFEDLDMWIENEYNFHIYEDDHKEYSFCFLAMLNWIEKEQIKKYGKIDIVKPYTKDKIFHIFRYMVVKNSANLMWGQIESDRKGDESEEDEDEDEDEEDEEQVVPQQTSDLQARLQAILHKEQNEED